MKPVVAAVWLLAAGAAGAQAPAADPCAAAYHAEMRQLEREARDKRTGVPQYDRKAIRHVERRQKAAAEQAEKCQAERKRAAGAPEKKQTD